MKVAVINGVNMNLLGAREPEKYSTTGLTELQANLQQQAQQAGVELICQQSNHEGELVDYIHGLRGNTDYIIINPAAFTHTSIALRDALLAVAIPFIEVHISNVAAREEFRQFSYFSDIAIGSIIGLGVNAYHLALHHLIEQNQRNN